MSNPRFYDTFQKDIVAPNLLAFQSGTIDDCKVRALLVTHASAIYKHYQDQNLLLGNLDNYIRALQEANDLLDKTKLKTLGYMRSFLPLALDFVSKPKPKKDKEKKDDTKKNKPTRIQEIITIATQNNAKTPDGKTPIFQITTQAECDLLKLVLDYMDFFILSGKCTATFDSSVINTALKLPIEDKLKKRYIKLNQRVHDFENPHKPKNIQSTSSITNMINAEQKISPEKKIKKQGYFTKKKEKKEKEAELKKKKAQVITAITAYIKNLSRFNYYGKIRAIELINELGNCKKSYEDYNSRLNAFLATGKTHSDTNKWNFFRSIRRCSGTGDNSLRGKILHEIESSQPAKAVK